MRLQTALSYKRVKYLSGNLKKYSNFLSFVLRHKPESIGITLDKNGWVEVSVLLEASRVAGQDITIDLLKQIVATNDKQRFAFNDTEELIRANQGHSVKNIDLNLNEIVPPNILYHGTVEKFIDAIMESGLQRMSRQYVHLSEYRETATNVGSRRGKPIILIVQAAKMHEAGFVFYCSENGVWLTESVPSKYIEHEIP